jgi:hypothetical protein
MGRIVLSLRAKRHRLDTELERDELAAIGYVAVLWAHLEHVLPDAHNTGNFIDSELSGALTRAKTSIKSVPYEQIPYASEQGIFCGLAGN